MGLGNFACPVWYRIARILRSAASASRRSQSVLSGAALVLAAKAETSSKADFMPVSLRDSINSRILFRSTVRLPE